MSRFAPVFLPDDRRLNGRASQTFLRHMNGCPRSAYLYALYKGEARTVEMMRGAALHAVCERATRAAVEQNEATIPPEVVKAICDEVLADPDYPVPLEEHDYIREMSYRWASEAGFNPAGVVAVETLFVLDVAGWQVRAKIDYAELLEDGAAVYVADWKSSRAAPAFEEVARRRSDGSLAAKSFQIVLYALALAYGVPVRVEPCIDCEGTGRGLQLWEATGPVTGPMPDGWEPCDRCEGHGRVEIPEPFPVASRAQRFDLEYVYPGIEDREGKMLRRPVSLSRLELEEYRASFDGLLSRVADAERSGQWPAVVSDAACGECPAASMCPIPEELRDFRGTINTVEQASEAAEVLDRRSAVDAAIRKEIKAFAKAHGVAVRFGADQVWEFGYMESERIADKDGLWAAVERARRYGEEFDPASFVKVVKSTPFRQRTLTAEELAIEPEGSNDGQGREDDGERRLDERFGAAPPY